MEPISSPPIGFERLLGILSVALQVYFWFAPGRHKRVSVMILLTEALASDLREYRRIENIFSDVKELWTQARIHPLDTPDILGLSYPHLASHCSLMNVYTCAAYVLMYFNTDILRPVIKERYTRATDIRVEGWEPPRSIVRNGIKHVTRSYRMQDHRMHRLFMPLNVAIEQCDKIRPQTLAHCVADWLASTIPTYVACT